jgi:hypothetical protein
MKKLNHIKISLGTQKGFMSVLLILLGLIVIGGGVYLYKSSSLNNEVTNNPEVLDEIATSTNKSNSNINENIKKEIVDEPSEQVFCTMDAMECPDGSYVGRTGPNCEFVCPNRDTVKNHWNGNYLYENERTIFNFSIHEGDAVLVDDGFQTQIRFNAKTQELDGKLLVLFDSYGPEDMFKNGYSKGDLLFTISNIDGKYIITWGKFKGLSDNETDEFKKLN